jgi:signal peptidase I
VFFKNLSPPSSENNLEGNIHLYQTAGFSMWPYINPNDVLVVKPLPHEQLDRGDLVVFRNASNVIVVHRLMRKIITKEKVLLQTKGDANYFFDQPICYGDIIGRAFAIIRPRINAQCKLINLDNFFHKICGKLLARSISFLNHPKTRPF